MVEAQLQLQVQMQVKSSGRLLSSAGRFAGDLAVAAKYLSRLMLMLGDQASVHSAIVVGGGAPSLSSALPLLLLLLLPLPPPISRLCRVSSC